MQIEPLQITVDGKDLTVYPQEPEIQRTEDGSMEIMVNGLEITVESPIYQSLDEPIEWEAEVIIKEFRNTWLENEVEWPDTSDKEWNSPQILNNAPKQRKATEIVVKNAPVTARFVKQQFSDDSSPGNAIYNAKQNNLIKSIGRTEQGNLLVPTHIGHKEFSFIEELEVTKA